MLKKYFLWASLSALGLAGCSRSERTPATAGVPGAASSVPPAVPAAPAPTILAEASQPGADAAAPAPAATSAETTRLLALLDGPRRCHDTTLASATPDTLAAAAEASAPDSARTAALRRYLQGGLPAAQVFMVQPGRDTLLLGAQGTQVLVPAHAWNLPDSTAEVRLALREFYTPADIILAGLSTTSGTQLLETGGMVHLVATVKGQPVDLLPNRPVLLRFPTRRAQPDMQLFEGVKQGAGRALDWQLPTAHGAATGRRAVVRPGNRAPKSTRDSLYIPRPTRKWPVLRNFQADMAAQVRRQLPQPKRLRRPSASRLQKNFLTKAIVAYNQRTVHRVSLRFTIDSAGTVSAIESLPGSDFVRSLAAVAALQRLGRWQPATVPYFGAGQVCTEAVAVHGHVTVLFSREGGVSMTSLNWVLDRASRPRAQQRQHEVRELLASPSARRLYLHQEDSVTAIRQAQERAQWAKDLVRLQADEARLRTQFTDTSRAAITQAGVYNELWAQGLYWINCDRFTEWRPKVTYQVRLAQRDAVVNLIFQELNSVMRGVEYVDGVSFIDVPRKQRATVVALRREGGVTYLAKQLVELTKAPLTELRFHPVTMAQLRAELAQP